MKKLFKVLSWLVAVFISLVSLITQPIWAGTDHSLGLKVDTLTIRRQVTAFTSLQPGRSHDNLVSLNAAADTIKQEWERLGYSVREQKFHAGGNEYRNLLIDYRAKENTESAETLIVGAHYDVCMDLPGADDNASGVVGLLQIARLLKEHQPELDYNIQLVAFTLEEPPYFRSDEMGSNVHAKSLVDEGVKVKGMVCLEMIGYFNEEKGSQTYPVGFLNAFYPNTGDFITVVGKVTNGGLLRKVKRGMNKGGDIDVRSINSPPVLPGVDFSDHLNYWRYDYDAVMITNTAFFRNHAYHTANDTPDRLDYPKMAEVIKGAYNAIISL